MLTQFGELMDGGKVIKKPKLTDEVIAHKSVKIWIN